MPPVRPRRVTSRSRLQYEHRDGSDNDEEALHDDAAVLVAQGGSREAAWPSGRRAGSRSVAEARAPARKDPKHTGARHPPSDDDDEAAEGADDDGEEGVTDEDDEDDSDGAFEDYYDDEVKPSDYKNGDLLLPQGPYGNLTYQITFAAKKRGNVKMVLAPLAQQIVPPCGTVVVRDWRARYETGRAAAARVGTYVIRWGLTRTIRISAFKSITIQSSITSTCTCNSESSPERGCRRHR